MWKNPEFDEFPVLGLSEVQMDRYCKWRSEAFNLLISNPEIRCSGFRYWKKFDKLDPGKQYKVVYSIPSAEDIAAAGIKGNQYGFAEILSNGILEGEAGEEPQAFRCKAVYVKTGK